MTQVPNLNPFDPASLRLNQSLADTAGAKRLLTTVPVGKPSKQEFFRVHTDPDFSLSPAAIVELKDDREIYLLTPEVAEQLPGEFTIAKIVTVMTRQSVVRLWPIKLPTTDGRQSEWHRSAAEAAELAASKWIRLSANMSIGAYDIYEAIGELPEPNWPSVKFTELLAIAFRGHIVRDLDHPLIRRLRGAA